MMPHTAENDATVTIMGNAKGPACSACGRKIKQGQRVRTVNGRKVHAYHRRLPNPRHTRVITPELGQP